MSETKAQARGEIRRATGEDGATGEVQGKAAAALDSVMFAPWLEGANRTTERRELRARAMAPIAKAIGEDDAAVHAAKTLMERVGTDIDALRPHRKVESGGAGGSWGLGIDPGISILTPPYEYVRTGPTYGKSAEVDVDSVSGEVDLTFLGDGSWDGGFAVSGAVGFGLEVARRGYLSVRPFVRYSTWWFLTGFLLEAACEAHLGFLVEEDGGPVVAAPQPFELFDERTESEAKGSDEDILRAGGRDAHFVAEPGRRYRVWVWGSVSGDQSGAGISLSFANGILNFKVPFVGATLY